MSDRPSADRTAELLFWYYRKPSRYQAEGRRRDAPLLDPEVILKLALLRPVEFVGAAWKEARRIPALQEAATAYVRHMFFRPDATPYQALGLEPGASPKEIKESFRLLMQLVHPDRQGGRRTWPDACAAQANWAYSILRVQDTRRTFEEEAEARAALARAINRAAMAAEASQMPVAVWPKTPPKGARSFGPSALPEWLTAGVGGFVREHPAMAAFAILIGLATLIIGTTLLGGDDGLLIRVAREVHVPAPEVTPAPATAGSSALVMEPPSPRNANAAAQRSILLASTASGIAYPQESSERGSAPSPESPVSGAGAVPDPTIVQSSPPGPAERVPEPSLAPPSYAASSMSQVVARIEPLPQPEAAGVSVAIGAPPAAAPLPPADTEVQALFATFVDSYERGRVDAFIALFADDADTNLRRGRAAIRGEYDELFRLSNWRRMQLTHINWRRVGDRAVAKGEITVRIGWRDGREVEQRLNVNMELARSDGRVVIARLSHQPKDQ